MIKNIAWQPFRVPAFSGKCKQSIRLHFAREAIDEALARLKLKELL